MLGEPIAEPPTEEEILRVAEENTKAAADAKAEGKTKAPIRKKARGNICVIFSCENLLLNAIRQQHSGFPAFLCCDFTHRLVFEKYNVLVMGTVDPAQHFHAIAYAMTSHEDEATHERVFTAVRDEVNAIVAERARAEQAI